MLDNYILDSMKGKGNKNLRRSHNSYATDRPLDIPANWLPMDEANGDF